MNGKLPAVILAGGRATRMGGGDKSLKPLAGRPMLSHIIERLKPQVGLVALSANGDPARFEAFGLPVIRDTVSGFAGPLAGVLAGMEWALGTGNRDHLVSVAGDTPFFPSDLVQRLVTARSEDSIISLASSGGRMHSAFAIWPLALRDDLVRLLTAGASFRVTDFVEQNAYKIVEFPAVSAGSGTVDPFFNINTVDELETAETICRAWEQ